MRLDCSHTGKKNSFLIADGSIIIIGRSGLGRTGDGIIVIIVIIVIIDGGERRRERGMLSRSRSGARRLRGR